MSTVPAGIQDPFGLVGETLAGRFRIDLPVAEGGFGVVYRAWQITLDRPVAIKVFKTGNDVSDEAFQAEAHTIARLKHPSIVEVHDFGVWPVRAGVVLRWMALEWLDGRTLEAFLDEARATGEDRMPPARALALLRPVFQAIGLAHRAGVVHRDLKPGNILLTELAGGIVPKVLDFGVAQMLAGEDSGGHEPPAASGRTTRGMPGFSPDYAAPEQVSYGRTGPWTDVHALGLILTEMLTGERPYPGGESEARFAAIVAESRPTPAAKGVAVGNWEPVLARSLVRRPADRYPDADAFLQALESSVATEPAHGAGAPTRWRARTLGLGAVAIAVALVLAGGDAYHRWRNGRPTPTPARVKLAVLPFANLSGDQQQDPFSEGLTEGMISDLGRLEPERLAVIAGSAVSQYRGSNKNARQIGEELGVDYLLESSVRRTGNRVRIDTHLIQASDQTQIWGESYDREVRDVLSLQNEVAQAIAASVRVKLNPQAGPRAAPGPINPTAYASYMQGSNSPMRNKEQKRLAITDLERATTLEPTYAPAHATLAHAYYRSLVGGDDRPDVLGPKAKASALRALELNGELPAAHMALAKVLAGYSWDWAGAEKHFLRALELVPEDHDAHVNHGFFFLTPAGRFDQAVSELRRGIAFRPLGQASNSYLGFTYYLARRYDEALAQLQRTIEIDAAFWFPHYLLARVYATQGRHREALASLENTRDATSDSIAALRGHVLARAGRPKEALRLLAELRRAAQIRYVPPSQFAMILVGLDRRDEALAALANAVAEHDHGTTLVAVDPVWDPLRDDPGFANLVRQVGVPTRP